MKHEKWIYIVVTTALLIFLFSFCVVWWLPDSSTELKNGFDSELLNTLSTQYQITIPDNAVFVDGVLTNSRDPYYIILFELPLESELGAGGDALKSYLCQALAIDETRCYFNEHRDDEVNTEWYEQYGGKLEYCLTFNDLFDSFLSCTLHEDKIVARFVGGRPLRNY